MIAFSVAVTEASSRNIFLPAQRRARSCGTRTRRLRSARRALRAPGDGYRRGGGRWRRRPAWRSSPRRSAPAAVRPAESRRGSSCESSGSGSTSIRPSRGCERRSAPAARPSRRCPSMIWSMTRTSWMSGRLRSTTGSSVSRHAARIGSAAFLFPPGRMSLPAGGRLRR